MELDTVQHDFLSRPNLANQGVVSSKMFNSEYEINPSTFIFRPLELKLADSQLKKDKVQPYCVFKLGWHSAKTDIGREEGIRRTWKDAVVLDRKHGETLAKIKVKNSNGSFLQDTIGKTSFSLSESIAIGGSNEWVKLYKGKKIVGEVLLNIEYREFLVH